MKFFAVIIKIICYIPSKIFAKRTLLFVTNSGIRTFTLSPLFQFSFSALLVWVGMLFHQSVRYDTIIKAKVTEINKLKSINRYFENEFSALNDELHKINEYLKTISSSEYLVSSSQKTKEHLIVPNKIKKINLSGINKKNINHLQNINQKIQNVESFALDRISKIEEAIVLTGLSVKKMPRKDFLNKTFETPVSPLKNLAQGGPLKDYVIESEKNKISDNYDFERSLKKVKFKNKVSHLIFLENIADSLPLKRPMKDFYVSSGFGYREDPITKRKALHRGQDFVGPRNSEIYSPSKGKVILAGKFYEYGNAVVIDHGFGVTTRYGHLSKIKVKKGQIVKAGELIGLQGSTGRSTGHHLHYEVRYKNKPLNPNKFISAGDHLFEQLLDENNATNYIKS